MRKKLPKKKAVEEKETNGEDDKELEGNENGEDKKEDEEAGASNEKDSAVVTDDEEGEKKEEAVGELVHTISNTSSTAPCSLFGHTKHTFIIRTKLYPQKNRKWKKSKAPWVSASSTLPPTRLPKLQSTK